MFNITIFTWYLVNTKFDKISKLLLAFKNHNFSKNKNNCIHHNHKEMV